MNWLDQKYLLLISHKLERFKKIGSKFNFRCVVCGDSKKNKSKARAWIYSDVKGQTKYGCFNCGASDKFPWFLKSQDSLLYGEYLKELLGSNIRKNLYDEYKQESPSFLKKGILETIKKCFDLEENHPARKYLLGRKLDPRRFYYVPKFKNWVNSIIPEKFESIEKDEPRLIIPFFDENKILFGFQGRSFNPKDNAKYITIMLDDRPKLYGLDRIDKSKRSYWTEGPIDSEFLDNAGASCGGRIENNLKNLNLFDPIIIYDNEKRSPETIKKMENAIAEGFSLFIWPSKIKQKDINDLVLAEIEPKTLINTNIFKGIEAKLKLIEWKRI